MGFVPGRLDTYDICGIVWGMRQYLYIVYLNGIVWDSVNAPNKNIAKRRATTMVKKDLSEHKTNPNAPMVVTVETVKTFLGH